MDLNIIQHHEVFDFKTFYESVRPGYIGIDFKDFEIFMQTDGMKHSFIGKSGGSNRIQDACANALYGHEEIVRQASSMMITIVRSPDAPKPLKMEEMLFMNEFISTLPDGCDVIWGIADDPSLGNEVRIILLVNIK